MKTSDFDYELPPERIAQTPVEPRHQSRLLVVQRENHILEHAGFWNLGSYLKPGDLLVINRTRVIPARVYARKSTGGKIEILLLRRIDALTWEALVGGKRLTLGKKIRIEGGPTAVITGVLDGSCRQLMFHDPIEPFLDKVGHVPLPPYIHTPLNDPARYQTVYAREPGSAAAPTAGLHFTPELMRQLEELGIRFTEVTLHVGLDTFAPVTENDPTQHKIHKEWCEVTPEAAAAIQITRSSGGRIVAVGTTSVRTLESAALNSPPGQLIAPFSGFTDLFILPGYKFRTVDAMITNFHLPRSSLLMLVSAFAGREFILNAYRDAIQSGYRFYSFGDAMLIL